MTYIGIEGGGTTTRVFFKKSGEPQGYFDRPVSLKVNDGNFAESAAKLYELLSGLVPIASVMNHRSTVENVRLAIGLSGMSRVEDQESLKAAILAWPEFGKAKIHIESDATLTLKTVLDEAVDDRSSTEEGILLIAGTGSVIFYQSLGEPPKRIGGWGPPLSDEGSGYRMGLKVLQRYIWVLDGVGEPDALTERTGKRLTQRGMKDIEDRAELSRIAKNDAAFVASFARDALDAALDHGPFATEIKALIREELSDLARMIRHITKKGMMRGKPPYKLFLSGSIARHPVTLALFRQSFDIREITPILVGESAPAMKALQIAKGLSEP